MIDEKISFIKRKSVLLELLSEWMRYRNMNLSDPKVFAFRKWIEEGLDEITNEQKFKG